MHVFNDGRCRSRSTKKAVVAQFVIAILGVPLALTILRTKNGDESGAILLAVLVIGMASLGVVAEGYRAFATFFGRPAARVILTSRTLAVKVRKKPAQFFKRAACHSYSPERMEFHFEEGVMFTPRMFVLVIDEWKKLPTFIFERWWDLPTLEAMKSAVDEELPISRWFLVLYFGQILIIFVLALTAIIVGATERFEMTTVYGLWGGVVGVGLDWLRRHRWLARREAERGSVQFSLPSN